MSESDYCDLCDLPRSTCVHGMPAPEPKPAAARASRAAPKPRVARPKPEAAARPVTRRWTPPEQLKPVIVQVLSDAGGELEADEVMSALGAELADRFREADHEPTPEGEPRWQLAARKARQALIGEGVMSRGRPGVWELSDR
jgi:hypothetical protein